MDANKDLLLKDESFAIVGAAMEVHSQLGAGFLEAVYSDALALELEERGIPFRREVPIKSLGDVERAKSLNYRNATGYPLALILNFGASKLDWMRLVKTT